VKSLSLHIRPFEPADQDHARRLILEGLGERFGSIDETLNADLDDISGTYVAAGHPFVVAEVAGKLAGTGALLIQGQELAQIVRVTVHPAHRSRRIGLAIVTHLLAFARQRGITRVIVETNLDWESAIALYRRCGFAEYGRDEISVYMKLDLEPARRLPAHRR
jgi:ribosomal protein S18 acetylase RimI-like enzyme